VGQVTTIIIMLHVNLRYNERRDFLQGYGQVTWPEHTFIVPPTCHVTRMINKNTLKGNKQIKMVHQLVQNDVACLFNYKDLV
jgi:hypothetical protein